MQPSGIGSAPTVPGGELLKGEAASMPHPFISVRQIREQAGYSQTAAAALAGVAPNTWVRYELDPEAGVSRVRKPRCDAAATKLAEIARKRTEAA